MADERTGQKEFYRSLKDKHFARAYFLHGADDFLKDSAVRDMIRATTDPSTRDFNLEMRRGAELDAPTLRALVGTPPMMADQRVVIIRDVPALRKDARAALERYLAAPAADVVLVLMAPAGAKSDKALEKLARGVLFEPLSGDRVPVWIAHHARENLKVEIEASAAALLQAAVGDELAHLAPELEKLASFVAHRGASGGSPAIDEAAVQAVVGARRGETMSDLLDRVAERDAAGALPLVEHVLTQPKASGVTTVMAIGAQTLAIAYARALITEGVPAFRVSSGVYDLLKSKSIWLGRSWGEAVPAIVRAASSGCWTDRALDQSIAALAAADIALKNTTVLTGAAKDEQVVSALILALCAADAPRRAA